MSASRPEFQGTDSQSRLLATGLAERIGGAGRGSRILISMCGTRVLWSCGEHACSSTMRVTFIPSRLLTSVLLYSDRAFVDHHRELLLVDQPLP